MKSNFIKKIVEEKVKISDEKFNNQVKITFESSKEGTPVNGTITLSGEGSLKVLMPV